MTVSEIDCAEYLFIIAIRKFCKEYTSAAKGRNPKNPITGISKYFGPAPKTPGTVYIHFVEAQ